MTRLLAAEWLKLRTVRTMWLLLAGMLVLTGLAVVGAITLASGANLDLESERGVRTVLHVSAAGAVFVLVLGVIISAGEYRQGTAIETFLTTPRRSRMVVAKLVTAAGMGMLFGALAAIAALVISSHVYAVKGYAFPLASSEAWSVLAGAVVYAALFGALGAATGSLVRNQVAVIVGWLVWLLLAENIVVGIAPGIGRWLPGAAGRALVRDPNGDLLGQPAGALVLAVYTLVIGALAIGIERRRDA